MYFVYIFVSFRIPVCIRATSAKQACNCVRVRMICDDCHVEVVSFVNLLCECVRIAH